MHTRRVEHRRSQKAMALGRRNRFELRARCLAIVAVLCLAGCSGDRTQRHATQAPAVGSVREEVPAAHATGPIALSSLRGRIAFSHADDVWVADANGEHPRRLTRRPGPELDPSWSPDGKKIAYRDSRRGINNNDEIYVMDSDGRRPRNLTHGPVDEWSPSWSPDGKLIAFFSGDLYVMRPDGGDARAITKLEGEYPAWSRDGRRLAFMSAEPGA